MALFPIYEDGYLPGPNHEQDSSFLYDDYPTSPPVYIQEVPYEDEPYKDINIQDSYVEYEKEEDELPEAWIPYSGHTELPPGSGNQQVIIGAPFPQPSDLKQHYCDLYPEECHKIGGVLERNNTSGNGTIESDMREKTGLSHVDLSGCGLALLLLLLLLLGLNGGWSGDKASKDREGLGKSDGRGGKSDRDSRDKNGRDGKSKKREDEEKNKKNRDRESSGKDDKGKPNREDRSRNKNSETPEERDKRKAAERAERQANGKDGRNRGNKGETPEERAERKSRERERQKNRNGETPEERSERKARDAAKKDRDKNRGRNGKDKRSHSGETPEERQARKDRERRDRNRDGKGDRSNRETPEERQLRKDRKTRDRDRGKDRNSNGKSDRSNRETSEERQARKNREASNRDRGKSSNGNNHKSNEETPEERKARKNREKDRKNGQQRSPKKSDGQNPLNRSDRKKNGKNETPEERAERHRREGRESPEERAERHRRDRENKDREKKKQKNKKNETPEERAERHRREGRETPEEREARHKKEREQKKGQNETPEERAERHRREGRETPQEKTDRLKKEKKEQGRSWLSPSMLLGLLVLLALMGFAGRTHIPQGMPGWNWRTPNLFHKPSGIIGGSLLGEGGGLLGKPRSFVKGSPKVIPSRSKWKVNEPAPHIHINNVNSQGNGNPISFGVEPVVVEEVLDEPVIVKEKIWEPISFQFTGPTNPNRLLNMLFAALIVSLPLILDWIRDYPEIKYDQPDYISSSIQLLISAGLILFGLLIADWHFGWSTTMAPYAEVSVDSVQSGLTPVLVGAVETTEQLVWGLEDVLFGDSRVLLGMGLAALGVFFLAQREPNLDIPSTDFSNYTTQALVFLGALLVGMLLWNA
ncbi:hypothetical protein I204_08477 [Kwoniella mangroviensis CBS 8886]|nr:uncharacterized protein I203_01517 [Kwoniella mangroviensis CBS 8507]OCF69653.1 hypothetical protein I203_01517 [Kwoniella mangroviensis CBS 8507]OCF70847.1 hypothetical protein I204_08477 [Kwoniella mangroviensis CBS 8886]